MEIVWIFNISFGCNRRINIAIIVHFYFQLGDTPVLLLRRTWCHLHDYSCASTVSWLSTDKVHKFHFGRASLSNYKSVTVVTNSKCASTFILLGHSVGFFVIVLIFFYFKIKIMVLLNATSFSSLLKLCYNHFAVYEIAFTNAIPLYWILNSMS